MAEDKLSRQFGAVTERLRASTTLQTPDTESKKGLDRFRREKTGEQDNKLTISKVDLDKSPIGKILADAALDPKEKAEKIAALLFFNEEDLEANPKAIEDNQAMVAHYLDVFVAHNRQSIELTRDNPLSELRAGLRDVLDEYHQMVGSRSDLKDKLTIIDGILSEHGGAEGLIKALLSAKDKELEKEALDKAVSEQRIKVDGLTGELRDMDTESRALQMKIAENDGDPFLFIKGDKKRQLAEDKRARADVQAKIDVKREDLKTESTTLDSKSAALTSFVSNEDYKVHEQILEILDIGTDEFKAKLTELSNLTLGYIDNTENTLEGVSAQLKGLLGRVTDVHLATQNTVEQVTILLEGQKIAQEKNSLKLQEIESEEVEGGVAAMKRTKKIRALNEHVTSLEKANQSTASIAGELGKTQIDMTLFKDQMEEGLASATQNQMLSIATAAATGNSTVMRIETLATFVQGLVSEGTYKQEMAYHLGDMAKEMERGLMARMARNENVKSLGEVVKSMQESMEERNDIVLQIAEERKQLIDRLIDNTAQLGRTNEAALAIESEVNRTLFAKPEDDKTREGQSGAGAPSAPGLG